MLTCLHGSILVQLILSRSVQLNESSCQKGMETCCNLSHKSILRYNWIDLITRTNYRTHVLKTYSDTSKTQDLINFFQLCTMELKACDNAQKAELFAQYFASVFSPSSDWNPSCIDINTPDKTISSFDCSEEMIQTILRNLDVSKSSGIDAIPGCFWKATSAVSHFLHQFFSKIQQTATFPESWNKAVVTPVWKKEDKRAVEKHSITATHRIKGL